MRQYVGVVILMTEFTKLL